MPIQQRKFIIMRHNAEQEGIKAEHEKEKLGANTTTVNGLALNEFARMEQGKEELQRNQ